jgi:hypothetical protein
MRPIVIGNTAHSWGGQESLSTSLWGWRGHREEGRFLKDGEEGQMKGKDLL